MPIMYLLCAYYEQAANYPVIRIIPHQHCHGVKVNKADVCLHLALLQEGTILLQAASVINVISLNKEYFLLVYIAVCLHIQFIGSLCDHNLFTIHTYRYLIMYCGKLYKLEFLVT